MHIEKIGGIKLTELKQETQALFYLRHRWSRIIDIWTAHTVFRQGEILTGEDKVVNSPEVAVRVAQTLEVTMYSYIYSLFDASKIANPVNFVTINEELELDPETQGGRDKIISRWGHIHKSLKLIRNRIGFHQDTDKRATKKAYEQFWKNNPLEIELLMQYLRLFFGRLDFIYERQEKTLRTHNLQELDGITEYVRKLENIVVNKNFEEIVASILSSYKGDKE